MRVTIERLRLGILALAGTLLVVVLLFFGYARWQIRRIRRDLPAKLGVEIEQSSNGFTFSKSQGGRTLFTLHAAKTVQYKSGGHATLHDVSITLYGTQGSSVDHVYGDEFDYDPVNGIVRADGTVQIDLELPAGSSSPAAATASGGSKSTVHVETAGLVFNEKTGMASTSQRFEFHLPQGQGSAMGASFDSAKGVLILEREIVLDSNLDGSPLVLHAGHAQYQRGSRILHLLQDETEYAENRSSSDQATVYFRPDGSASQVEAQGHVNIVGSADQRITARRAHISLDLKSQPRLVALDGGVLYVSDDGLRQVHGAAAAGTLFFSPGGTVRKAHLETAVSIVEQEKPRPQTQNPPTPDLQTQAPRTLEEGGLASGAFLSQSREVRAGTIDVDFSTGASGRPVAQRLLATGPATGPLSSPSGDPRSRPSIDMRTLYAAAPPEETSIEADRLLAILQSGVAVSSLQGDGHTKLTMAGPKPGIETSTGDKLLLTFAAPPPKALKLGKTRAPAPPAGAPFEPATLQSAQLQSLEQTGDVRVVETSAGPAPGSSRTLTASAERATYEARTQIVRLYGGPPGGHPLLREADGELTGETIDFDRATGDVTATGQVQATYRQSPAQPGIAFGGAQPVHVVAGSAHLDHATGLTIFYGVPDTDARLWQGADSISAPVLELLSSRQTLKAHDVAGGSRAQAVTAVFVSRDSGLAAEIGSAETMTASTVTHPEGSLMRVNSRTLFYSGIENKAVFDGGVAAQVPSGSLNSSVMEVYFSPSAMPGSGEKPGQNQAQQVERIVAMGGDSGGAPGGPRKEVQLEQPGRKAVGTELVYTARDSRFVLTGTISQPPRLVDRLHGTVTGASLIFNNRDDSVIVSGGPSKAVTETRTGK